MSQQAPPQPRVATQVDRWRALGTYVDLRVDDPGRHAAAAALARDVLAAFEQACSRFRADSDLSRANAAAGHWVRVSPLLVAAVEVAVHAAHDTDGLVDPTLGQAIVALGYDRSFDELIEDRSVRALPSGNQSSPTELPTTEDQRQLWRDLEFTPEAIRVPRGAALDLGGTGKALAADLVAAAIVETLQVGLIVSVGGEVRAHGPGQTDPAASVPAASVPAPSGAPCWCPPGSEPASIGAEVTGAGVTGTGTTWSETSWPVVVAATVAELPPGGVGPTEFSEPAARWSPSLGTAGANRGTRPLTSEVIGLAHGGLATSSVAARRWITAGQRHHHILDPRTGTSAATCWRYASVQAETCSIANAASLAAIVLGDEAPAWLTHRGLSARLVDHAGSIVRVGAWPTPQAGAA